MPSDLVCNDVDAGLWLNGRKVALTAGQDNEGHPLPVWQNCRHLAEGELFTFADHVPNSFDGRHYGPIERSRVVGVYRMIWRNPGTR